MSLRVQVLTALSGGEKMTSNAIADLTNCEASDVNSRLHALVKMGHVDREKDDITGKYAYWLTLEGCESYEKEVGLEADITEVSEEVSEDKGAEDLTQSALDNALTELEAKLSKPRVVVDNLEIKVKTLKRIAVFLDDSIRDVLLDVASDLEAL